MDALVGVAQPGAYAALDGAAAAGVSMRALEEWMRHLDIATTQLYADYAPSAHEAELVAAAFARETSSSGTAPASTVSP